MNLVRFNFWGLLVADKVAAVRTAVDREFTTVITDMAADAAEIRGVSPEPWPKAPQPIAQTALAGRGASRWAGAPG